MQFPTCFIASITSSAGIFGTMPASAISAHERALTVPTTFRFMQGTSTRPATGSQTRPSRFCSANPAAYIICPAVPLCKKTSVPAAIADAAPISAWQPPSAPEIDARFAIICPIPAETNSPCIILFSVVFLSRYSGTRTAGRTPHEPAVGAATIRFMHAFDSAI